MPKQTPLVFKPLLNLFTEQGLPLVPFPTIQRCLGLSQLDSSMKIKEGYAVLAYDFKVSESHPDCLFNLAEQEVMRKIRVVETIASSDSKFEKLAKIIKEQADQLLAQVP